MLLMKRYRLCEIPFMVINGWIYCTISARNFLIFEFRTVVARTGFFFGLGSARQGDALTPKI